jgi:endo-1,4-beta-mannosidase
MRARRRRAKMGLMERPSLRLGGAPWLGANFWSRKGGPLMWRTFDEALVRTELEVLRRHGLGVTRSFFYLPDALPAPDTIDPAQLDAFAVLLDLHREVGMTTVPTFLVGHMSGDNWDLAFRAGRDLYRDGFMLAQQAFFIREATRRFHAHPAVAGWLVSNEMPLWGGAGPHEYVRGWGQLMIQAIRAGGGTQPASLGDGAWGIEVTGADNGYRVRDIARDVDFVGPHVYPMGNDVVRQHLSAAFHCDLVHLGRPVILEEFGLTSAFASEPHAAEYYRQVLHTSLLAGATGWIAWNNTDFDLPQQDPYRHHPFELLFGLTRADGTPKRALAELASFAGVLDAVDFPRCRRAPSDVALVVSSFLEVAYPFTEAADRTFLKEVLFQAYVAAREADVPPAIVRERDGIPSGPRLFLVPSTKQLTAPGWSALEDRAREGATVYVSYSAGAQLTQRGLWHPAIDACFGVEHGLRYGLLEPVVEDDVDLRFVAPLGDLAPGDVLRFRAAGSEHVRARLPVAAREAEVLAVDGGGRPALLSRAVGAGRIVLSTYPFEAFAASRAHANPEPTWRLYRALARAAGALPAVTVDDPRILVDGLEHEDGRRFVWLVSEADEALVAVPQIAGGGKLARVAATPGPAPDGTVTLPPFGVSVLALLG